MLVIGWDNVPLVWRGNPRPVVTIHWVIFPPVTCWDRIAMDILDVCDPTPDGYRYILVIADYFSKWTEAYPIKDKCTDTVADVLVNKIILRFGMPLVIHSDQGRDLWNHCAHYWVASRPEQPPTIRSLIGWWNASTVHAKWCCQCS